VGLLLAVLFFCIPVPQAAVDVRPVPSVRLLDRHGHLLRELLSSEAGTSVWVGLDQVSPDLVLATLAAEDRRFYWHLGVDPIGVMRAVWQNAQAGRVESGASTLAMQLVGNATGVHPSGLRGKAWQGLQALRLMTVLSRRQVLERYLNTISYGHQAFGIEAAARYYFRCPAKQLSLAEAAMLASLPANPTIYDPFSNLEVVRSRQRFILTTLGRLGWVEPSRVQAAMAETCVPDPAPETFLAPHFTDMVSTRLQSRRGDVRTTLDLGLQHDVEGILHQRLAALKNRHATNGGVIVLDNASGDVLAWVGSTDYRSAQVDAVTARRQPGSTLKPFTYGLALERGFTCATVLPDMPFRYGGVMADYRPENYDGTFHGEVPLRMALACSYNAPAVYVLNRLGYTALYDRLKLAGFDSLNQPPDHYGLGLTLGDGEIRLLELARGYRSLACGGQYRTERIFLDEAPGAPHEVFSERVAYLLTNILSDHAARIPAFGPDSVLNLPFPCAAKTGTSNDFHDNWTVGYTPAVTVAVWVGNFDASPLEHVSGVTGAGGIFHDVMMRLSETHATVPFERPAGIVEQDVCPISGDKPGPYCTTHQTELFIRAYCPHQVCTVHQRRDGRTVTVYPADVALWRKAAGLPLDPSVVAAQIGIESPLDGEVFQLDPVLRISAQALHLAVLPPSGARQVQWFVDGQPYRTVSSPFSARWILRPGRHHFYVTTPQWQSATVSIQVK
jgi:penicillin-binding protein 1C